MTPVRLFGARYSVYTRIALLVLAEAEVPYRLEEVDIFRPEGVPRDYAARHPFAKIPALEHDGFRLFETDAIAAYVAALSPTGRALQSREARGAARMRQIMRIMDNYAYPRCVWGLYVPEYEGTAPGGVDAPARAEAARVLDAIADLAVTPFLQGDAPTLADLWALPMLAYLDVVPTGRKLLDARPTLRDWLGRMRMRMRMRMRESVRATRFPSEEDRAS